MIGKFFSNLHKANPSILVYFDARFVAYSFVQPEKHNGAS
jgi:hypothetical protein